MRSTSSFVVALFAVLTISACNTLLGISHHGSDAADPSMTPDAGDAGDVVAEAGDAAETGNGPSPADASDARDTAAAGDDDGARDAAETGDDADANDDAGESGAPPFLLDDFEDIDNVPADHRFATWQFYTYNDPAGLATSMVFEPGYQSNGAINLRWQVRDKPDGFFNSAGAGIRTLVSKAAVYVDLSKYQRIVFAHMYHNDGTCLSISQFSINIGCGEKMQAFSHYVPVAADWQTVSVDLSTLTVNAYPAPNGTPLLDCLAVADNIFFDVQRPLNDGECASGELDLDNISFR